MRCGELRFRDQAHSMSSQFTLGKEVTGMASVPYIDYKKLKDFYTIEEVCDLFQMEKNQLRGKSEFYHIFPRQNEIGDWGFVTYDVRKLHNLLYHEDGKGREQNPWA